MHRILKYLLHLLLPVYLIGTGYADTNSIELNQAVKKYYAGSPEQAVMILEPIAAAGDVNAQYLLANILYSLSNTAGFEGYGSPVKWYEMAAEQGVADASFALGVIYNNNWKKSADGKQAALAIIHFQDAVDLGLNKANRPLEKLKSRTGMSLKTAVKLTRPPEQSIIAKTLPDPVKKVPIEKVAKVEEKVVVEPEPEQVAKVEEKVVVEPEPEQVAKVEEKVVVEPEPEQVAKVEEKVVAEPEPEQVAEEPIQNEFLHENFNGDSDISVSLAELANECGSYTQVGFNFYADSIVGAWLTGSATVTKKLPGRWVNLTNDKFSFLLLLTLSDVPEELVSEWKVGQEIQLNGTIDQAQLVGASCAVNLVYQQNES